MSMQPPEPHPPKSLGGSERALIVVLIAVVTPTLQGDTNRELGVKERRALGRVVLEGAATKFGEHLGALLFVVLVIAFFVLAKRM
jgi:hypothetical protein